MPGSYRATNEELTLRLRKSPYRVYVRAEPCTAYWYACTEAGEIITDEFKSKELLLEWLTVMEIKIHPDYKQLMEEVRI
jgi:hypothetical protein